jgi:hypothetical protein
MKIFLAIIICLILNSTVMPMESAKDEQLRISTWYWLNSIEKEKWESDFQSVAQTGFTDIVLCWGLDSAAVLSQKENTRFALDLCNKHNLKAYLFIWHPTHNSLPRLEEFQQVDNKGNRLFTFNLFNRKWRSTQWRDYLQEVAVTYKDHPAFAGYLFDDTFTLGHVGSFGGVDKESPGDFVSYSAYDRELFRQWLQKKYEDLLSLSKAWKRDYKDWKDIEPPAEITAENQNEWDDWSKARRDWLREWAEETVKQIREIDGSTQHEIYAEDTRYVLGLDSTVSKFSFRPVTIKDTVGLDFGYVMQPFDAVCGYTFFRWNDPNSLEKAIKATKETLQSTREQMSNRKKIIYTFWASDLDIDRPLPLLFPTADQIISISKMALELGIRHVDYYGFRIGDWRVDEKEWVKLKPGKDPNYPLTKPMTGRFLCDRLDLLKTLAERHKELKQAINK